MPGFIQYLHMPPARWPLRTHVLASAILLLCIGAAVWGGMLLASSQWALLKLQREGAQAELLDLQGRGIKERRPVFLQTLPATGQTDDVMRDIGRYGQDAGVQINTVTIERRAATATQLGRVQFLVAAVAPYKSLKTWLADLLGRYPSLGIDSLAVQAQPSDPARQDVHLTLVWYVKD